MEIIIFLIINTVLGAIGTAMAEDRNRSAAGGFFLGLLLGLIGLAIIALMGKLPKEQEDKPWNGEIGPGVVCSIKGEDVKPPKEE